MTERRTKGLVAVNALFFDLGAGLVSLAALYVHFLSRYYILAKSEKLRSVNTFMSQTKESHHQSCNYM